MIHKRRVLSAMVVLASLTFSGIAVQASDAQQDKVATKTNVSVEAGEQSSAGTWEFIPALANMDVEQDRQLMENMKAQKDAEEKAEEVRKAEEAKQLEAEKQAALEKKAEEAREAELAAQEAAMLAAGATGGAEAVAATAGEQTLMAALIFCEAGNQPYEGQVAVGAVIMNRVRSGVYPNSITEVIYQPGQFGPAITGWLDTVLASGGYTDTAMQAAIDALAGNNPIGDCLYFGNGDYGMLIGDHYFH